MPQIKNDILFDKRLVERHIRDGLASREDYDKRLADLSDKEPEAEHIDIEKLADSSHSTSAGN